LKFYFLFDDYKLKQENLGNLVITNNIDTNLKIYIEIYLNTN
jgi:hypothetical protein